MEILQQNTIAIPVDMQERLMPVIQNGKEMLQRAEILTKGLKILNVPFLVPRQYPKGLGDTVFDIQTAVGAHTPIDKTSFGSLGEPKFIQQLKKEKKNTVVVYGAEAHVCVLQTVLQLRGKGYQVALVCDAIGSRNPYDKDIAIQRAKQAGALLTTVEALLFELLQDSTHPEFKKISALIQS